MRFSGDARLLLATRSVRGFADGLVSVVLASWLTHLGFSPFRIGVVVAGTLLGSAALTLAVGLWAHRVSRKTVLLATAALMALTGLAFFGVSSFWPVLLVAVAGTLNPSTGDVTPFLPTEQALLADAAPPERRTALFAWYNLGGALLGALGSQLAGVPAWLATRLAVPAEAGERSVFLLYAAVGLACALAYTRLSPHVEPPRAQTPGLGESKRVVLQLSALFSLDSFGGGFVVQSLLALWLFRRFGLSVATAGTVFFVTGALSAFSQLVSARLAERIGHVRTMVFTHLPANVFLMLAGVMPTAGLAIAFLLARMSLSQMDVPARQAYVMAIVPPERRAAAASVTNVPRSLASALAPVLAGALLDRSAFGWPLLIGGALKAIYDLVLFAQFRSRAARVAE